MGEEDVEYTLKCASLPCFGFKTAQEFYEEKENKEDAETMILGAFKRIYK